MSRTMLATRTGEERAARAAAKPGTNPKRPPTHALIHTPVSALVLVLDRDGNVLATAPGIESALRIAKVTPRAVSIVGAPSGRLLAT